jgi:hypothetical protein
MALCAWSFLSLAPRFFRYSSAIRRQTAQYLFPPLRVTFLPSSVSSLTQRSASASSGASSSSLTRSKRGNACFEGQSLEKKTITGLRRRASRWDVIQSCNCSTSVMV